MLPQISQGAEQADQIAVECAIADSDFRFVGIAADAAPECGGKTGQKPGTPIPGLYVFVHQPVQFHFKIAVGSVIVNRGIELFHRMGHTVIDRYDRVTAAQILCQLLGQILGKFGIVAAWQRIWVAVTRSYLLMTVWPIR